MKPKNIAASVHARLLRQAHDRERPFQELLQYFGMERFLYRLGRSHHADRFVLKGALMLRVWDAPTARPTRDVDLLGHLDNSPENLARVVRDVCDVTGTFAESELAQKQWLAFYRRGKFTDAPERLADVVAVIGEFILPVANACHSKSAFVMAWSAPGPWRSR